MRKWWKVAGLLSAVFALALLAACLQQPKQQEEGPPLPPPKPPELSPAIRAKLSKPGLYDLGGGKKLAVGTLRFRDIEGGFWAVEIPRSSAQETASVVIANPKDLRQDLQPLDGQYVAVGGTMIEGTISIRQAGPEMHADWIALVSDLAEASPTNLYGNGLFVLEDGTVFAQGWLERQGGKLLLFAKRPAKGVEPIAYVEVGNVASADLRGAAWAEMIGSLSSSETTPPTLVVSQVRGRGPADTEPGETVTGTPPRWRHVEKPGLKDLLGGRKRAVGMLYAPNTTAFEEAGYSLVFEMPWLDAPSPGPGAAIEATGEVLAKLRRLQGRYVAVEGRIAGERLVKSVPGRRAGGVVEYEEPVLDADSVAIVTTMTVEPGEQVMLR